MSAPQTNLERQKRRHAGPIVGMIAAALVFLVMFLIYTMFIAEEDVTPETVPPAIEETTSQPAPTN